MACLNIHSYVHKLAQDVCPGRTISNDCIVHITLVLEAVARAVMERAYNIVLYGGKSTICSKATVAAIQICALPFQSDIESKVQSVTTQDLSNPRRGLFVSPTRVFKFMKNISGELRIGADAKFVMAACLEVLATKVLIHASQAHPDKRPIKVDDVCIATDTFGLTSTAWKTRMQLPAENNVNVPTQ
jgi:histone H3/H4